MNLKIAIQKKGRLHDDSVRLLKECGIRFPDGLNTLKVAATNFPLEVFLLRDDDIPQYVEDGVAHIGIVGENVVAETRRHVQLVERLGFGRCRLALALPKAEPYTGLQDLAGKRIATSYPNVLGAFLAQHQVAAEVHTISGSVEIAPGIGLAEAICDLVSTGSTLLQNGLREVQTVQHSEAVLIAQHALDPAFALLRDRLRFRMGAVRAAKASKYIMLNAPNDRLEAIVAVLPGIKSPTVLPLAQSGWSSVHSVVGEDTFWEIIEELRANGAEGILVVPIEKMIGA
jgi:ATP phosphoribosyltransferase